MIRATDPRSCEFAIRKVWEGNLQFLHDCRDVLQCVSTVFGFGRLPRCAATVFGMMPAGVLPIGVLP